MSERPLSPHLQIYRWQITMALSILHRLSGLALSGGAVLIVLWLCAVAAGPGAYRLVATLTGSPVAPVVIFLWLLAFYYHLCNGLRHILWDAGVGLDLPRVKQSGWLVAVVAVTLSVVTWWLLARFRGLA